MLSSPIERMKVVMKKLFRLLWIILEKSSDGRLIILVIHRRSLLDELHREQK